MNKKEQVWKKIKELDIDFPVKYELYELIQKNLDRVYFVKDHVGIRDFVFLAEKETNFASEFFTAINVGCERSFSYKKNLEMFFEKYNDNHLESLKKIYDFFENTERSLYIGLGLKESSVSEEEDKETIIHKYSTGDFGVIEEVLKEERKFPEWYEEVAELPEEVKFITVKSEEYITKVLKPMNDQKLNIQINDILEKEDIKTKDKVLLKELVNHLSK